MIRHALPSEIIELKTLEQEYRAHYRSEHDHALPEAALDFRAAIKAKRLFILRGRKEIDAFMVSHADDGVYCIDALHVRDALRGRGLSHQLINHAETRARDLHCHRIGVWSDAYMARHVEYLKSQGWKPTLLHLEPHHTRVEFEL